MAAARHVKAPSVASSGSASKRSRADFTFGRVIGDGSYSSVVLATDCANGRLVAIKILSKQHIVRENKGRRSLLSVSQVCPG